MRAVRAIFALSATARAAVSFDDATSSALADDDQCGASASPEECGLHALQRRVAKVAIEDAEAKVAGHPTLHLEMYRAVRRSDLRHNLSNVDMGTIGGVLNYLHSDVVGEHVGNYEDYEPKIGFDERLNGVDSIVALDAHVKNPDSVIGAVGHYVDFALSAHFIEGEATGPAYNWNFGDIVGAQKGDDARWPYEEPYYRFSLSGFCPNLKWEGKRHGAYLAKKKAEEQEHGEAPAEGGRRRRRAAGTCMTYSNQFNLPYGEVLRGGLCPNGTEPGKMPTGGPGCTYTYEQPTQESVVSLDELVGITKEDCGGRPCENWKDFRRHCTNSAYHRKFNYHFRRRYNSLKKSRACVEYDIHKACAKDCNSLACKRVPASRREIGLPFWKGRCNSLLNAQRVERLAQAFGVASAGEKHQLLRSPNGETCLSGTSTLCQANATSGAGYCSRLWGGVCQPCYVPGTVDPVEVKSDVPACPWDTFRASQDYNNAHPQCSSDLPEDLCCLYTSSCNATLLAEPLNVTEGSFAYLSSQQDNTRMAAFLTRASEEAGISPDPERLSKMSYWQWGVGPKGKTLESVMAAVKHYFA